MFHVHHIDYHSVGSKQCWPLRGLVYSVQYTSSPLYIFIYCGWPGKLQVISRSLTTLPWGPQPTFLSPSQGQVHPLLCPTQPEATLSPWMRTQSISPWLHTSRSYKTNLAQITSGNTLQVMREAEQRHLQIMHEVVDSIKNDWSNRLTKQVQEYEQRLQDVEAKAIATIAEERKRGHELEARLNQAQATHMMSGLRNSRQRQTPSMT